MKPPSWRNGPLDTPEALTWMVWPAAAWMSSATGATIVSFVRAKSWPLFSRITWSPLAGDELPVPWIAVLRSHGWDAVEHGQLAAAPLGAAKWVAASAGPAVAAKAKATAVTIGSCHRLAAVRRGVGSGVVTSCGPGAWSYPRRR